MLHFIFSHTHIVQFNLSVRQMLKNLEFVVEVGACMAYTFSVRNIWLITDCTHLFSIQITGKCCNATPMNATLILSNSSSTIVTFPPFAITENDNNQVVTSIELEEYLLDRTLQSLILVTYTNGKVISTVTRNFSEFCYVMLI